MVMLFKLTLIWGKISRESRITGDNCLAGTSSTHVVKFWLSKQNKVLWWKAWSKL